MDIFLKIGVPVIIAAAIIIFLCSIYKVAAVDKALVASLRDLLILQGMQLKKGKMWLSSKILLMRKY